MGECYPSFMKNLASFALASLLFASPMGTFAQVAAAPDTCPCTDFRFVAKTDKAKAVATFWESRSKYHVASGLGTMALLFTAMTHQGANTLGDAERSFSEAQDELLRARGKAEKLGGLKVLGDASPDAKVVISLKKSEDYDLKEPR